MRGRNAPPTHEQTRITNKKYTIMERKEVFICRKTKEVQMLRGFLAALGIIKRDSAKWDGKNA